MPREADRYCRTATRVVSPTRHRVRPGPTRSSLPNRVHSSCRRPNVRLMSIEILYYAGITPLPRGVPSQLRVTRVPKGLQRGDRIWFTTGRCAETTGFLILAGAPERVDLPPTLSGGYSFKRVSYRFSVQRGSAQCDLRPITFAEGAEALWSQGGGVPPE